jgi:hypothetical protein
LKFFYRKTIGKTGRKEAKRKNLRFLGAFIGRKRVVVCKKRRVQNSKTATGKAEANRTGGGDDPPADFTDATDRPTTGT